MDQPRERAFRGPAIRHLHNLRLILMPLTEFVATAVRSSKVDLSWVYGAMRRIGDRLEESFYYEKLWILSLFSKVNYRRC
jgi:hypothetical protein